MLVCTNRDSYFCSIDSWVHICLILWYTLSFIVIWFSSCPTQCLTIIIIIITSFSFVRFPEPPRCCDPQTGAHGSATGYDAVRSLRQRVCQTQCHLSSEEPQHRVVPVSPLQEGVQDGRWVQEASGERQVLHLWTLSGAVRRECRPVALASAPPFLSPREVVMCLIAEILRRRWSATGGAGLKRHDFKIERANASVHAFRVI